MTMLSKAPILCMLLMAGAAVAQPPAAPAARPDSPDSSRMGTATGSEREPEAIAALEKMGAFLRTLTTFAVEGVGTSEEALTTGQKIHYPGTIDLLATRPNRLRA